MIILEKGKYGSTQQSISKKIKEYIRCLVWCRFTSVIASNNMSYSVGHLEETDDT